MHAGNAGNALCREEDTIGHLLAKSHACIPGHQSKRVRVREPELHGLELHGRRGAGRAARADSGSTPRATPQLSISQYGFGPPPFFGPPAPPPPPSAADQPALYSVRETRAASRTVAPCWPVRCQPRRRRPATPPDGTAAAAAHLPDRPERHGRDSSRPRRHHRRTCGCL